MRIALIYDAVYPWIKGGGEKTLYELGSVLRDRGHEIHLFGMHCWPGPEEIEREGLYYHAISPNYTLYDASGRRRTRQTLGYACGVYRRLRQYGLDRFDLIDLHAFPFAHLPGFVAVHRRWFPQTPWLLTWLEVWGPHYARNYLGWKGRIAARVERWAARTAPAHLCISPTTARRLETLLGVEPGRIGIVPRGFQPPVCEFDPTQRVPGQVVVVGRLMPYKRAELILDAWPQVVQRVPHARLRIVGGGPSAERCRQLAQESPVAAAIEFVGQLPDAQQVLTEIAQASLLVQPSTREGQSVVVLEAMSLGTPVLVAEGPETAVADFVGRTETTADARLPVEADATAWADRIVKLITDAELANRLAEHGRRQAASLGWHEEIAPRVEAWYQTVIDLCRNR